jgi:hypothetical protein
MVGRYNDAADTFMLVDTTITAGSELLFFVAGCLKGQGRVRPFFPKFDINPRVILVKTTTLDASLSA